MDKRFLIEVENVSEESLPHLVYFSEIGIAPGIIGKPVAGYTVRKHVDGAPLDAVLSYKSSDGENLEKLKSMFSEMYMRDFSKTEKLMDIYTRLGSYLANVKKRNVQHGDMLTNNIIIGRTGAPYLIDWEILVDLEKFTEDELCCEGEIENIDIELLTSDTESILRKGKFKTIGQKINEACVERYNNDLKSFGIKKLFEYSPYSSDAGSDATFFHNLKLA